MSQVKPRVRIFQSIWSGLFWFGLVSPTLLPAADHPAGTDKLFPINDDFPLTFAPGDFGFSDSEDLTPDVLTRVRISTLPALGTLRYEWEPVSAGDFAWLRPVPGVKWSPRLIRDWTGVASSADGTKLAATDYGGPIMLSADSGVTWSEAGESRLWQAIASSSDGLKLAAAAENDLIYTSTDGGLTWVPRGSEMGFKSIASSADGSRLAAVNGRIFTSDDFGATWIARETTRFWQHITSSADGLKLAAVELNGQIHISSDGGVTCEMQLLFGPGILVINAEI